MTGTTRRDRELMSVSIAAGPAVAAFLDAIAVTREANRTGLLTSSTDNAPTKLAIFPLTAAADPDRIVNDIRAIAAKHTIDHLIIECEVDRPPMAYASLFVAADQSRRTLTDVSQLIHTVFVIRPAALAAALLTRGTNSLPACFIAEQIEFVSDVFFDGDTEDQDFELARSLVLALNPRAKVWPLSEAALEKWCHAQEVPFEFEAAFNGAGWRQLIDAGKTTVTVDQRITAFGYRARRPFRPERFWKLLRQDRSGVFRAKGFFWLATRMDKVGGLNLAGSDLHCSSAGVWWAARDKKSRESDMPERTRVEWDEPFGDRRQSFAVMALEVDRANLQSSLDACLLSDAEMSGGPDSWKKFSDPFPKWSSHQHTHQHDHHECDHQHGSGKHDCCQH